MRASSFAAAVAALATCFLVACGKSRPVAGDANAAPSGTCTTCHGGLDNQTGAPPNDTAGRSDKTLPSVGAHTAHVAAGPLAAAFDCGACHVKPATVSSPGHFDGSAPVIQWGSIATANGTLSPAFDPTTNGCTSVYCHGSFAGGNAANAPVWTVPGAPVCGSCHGNPASTNAPTALPVSNHARLAPGSTNATCSACHPSTVDANGSVLAAGGAHVNGVVDVDPAAKHPGGWLGKASPEFHGYAAAQDVQLCNRCHAAKGSPHVTTVVCATCHDGLSGGADWTTTCNTCHGSSANAAPPHDTAGNTATTSIGVGAHQSHVTAATGISAPIDCVSCHQKPSNVYDSGHLDGAVTVSGYTGTDAAWAAVVKDPGWNASSATCGTSYCHGAFPNGNGTTNTPVWTSVGQGIAACGTCHDLPPGGTHPAVGSDLTKCTACHQGTMDAAGQLVPPASGGKHLNGKVDVSGGHPASWMDTASSGFHAFSADQGLAQCQLCHGQDLSGGFTGVACARCHDASLPPGVSTWSKNCVMCHGGADSQTGAPPKATWGNAAEAVRVGAHTAHVAGGSLFGPVDCGTCHVKPADAFASGHIDAPTASVAFTAVAIADGATPSWNRTTPTCAVYCHGSTLTGGAGSNTTPSWTGGSAQAACGTCHALPPTGTRSGGPHPTNTNCGGCHQGYTSTTVNLATHVNGVVDVLGLTCTSCHGDPARTATVLNPQLPAAPPYGTHGESDPAARAVGAHQRHLTPGPVMNGVPCGECHVVPTSVAHSNGVVGLSWGPLTTAGGIDPTTISFNGTSCSATYCHGNFAFGNAGYAPVWTGPATNACGTCHGLPPPNPHPQLADCGRCHLGYTGASVNVATHVNGRLDVQLNCTSCHGDSTRIGIAGADANVPAAPPPTATGRSPGAHLAHVNAAAKMAPPAPCDTCHTGAVPTSTSSHPTGTIVVAFGGRATAGGATPSYDAASEGCSTTYCHGNYSGTFSYDVYDYGSGTYTRHDVTYARAAPPAVWTGAPMACDSCHGNPPGSVTDNGTTAVPNWHSTFHGYDASYRQCSVCHPDASGEGASAAITSPAQHVNGTVDVAPKWTPSCFGCH